MNDKQTIADTPVIHKQSEIPSHFSTPGKLAKCSKCKRVFYFQPQHKHLSADDTEIIELGCTCPHCERWLHLGYLNEDLLKRQDELRNNRQKRAFKRDYKRWQIIAREMLTGTLADAGIRASASGKNLQMHIKKDKA